MKIQVASICKQEEDLIRPWLEHLLVLDCIEGIYLHDTGSTDATLDYIKSYKDPRIHLFESQDFKDFSSARNFILSKLDKPEWMIFLDIDELFNCNVNEGLEVLNNKVLYWNDIQKIQLPHIQLYDFNKIWFHKPPTPPNWDGQVANYSWDKDTITLYRGDLVTSKFHNSLHERFTHSEVTSRCFNLLGVSPIYDLRDLEDDFYVIHYSKAKLHAEARRTGKSFEYCVGKKRREYRLIKPALTNGKMYDREWALNATEADIEQLGRDQLIQFIEIEGHVFPKTNFNVYDLNNEFIKRYFNDSLCVNYN